MNDRLRKLSQDLDRIRGNELRAVQLAREFLISKEKQLQSELEAGKKALLEAEHSQEQTESRLRELFRQQKARRDVIWG